MNSTMPEINKGRTGDLSLKQQLLGILHKKSRQQSTKWTKKFFIIKDGWLIYYAENEKRELERRGNLNIHPEGIFPLDGCVISPVKENGHQFSLQIKSNDIEKPLVVAAESEFERDKWMETLQRASHITWANAELNETMIQRLESHGLQMAKEKQDVFERLQKELQSDEKSRIEELEQVNIELERERAKMEEYMQELQMDHERNKEELEETLDLMVAVDNDRKHLSERLNFQNEELESLAVEKAKIMDALQQKESDATRLSQENASLSQVTEDLQSKLLVNAQQTEQLLVETKQAKDKLHERDELADELEKERMHFTIQAQDLENTIKDLKAQKDITEAELKEEVLARMDAERRLKQAEESLTRLDHTVKHETKNMKVHVVEEMLVDVNKLKNFFENLSAESKVDPNKPVVMKNAIHARKAVVRRIKTNQFEERRKSSAARVRSSSLVHKRRNRPSVPTRRAVTAIFTQKSQLSSFEDIF